MKHTIDWNEMTARAEKTWGVLEWACTTLVLLTFGLLAWCAVSDVPHMIH